MTPPEAGHSQMPGRCGAFLVRLIEETGQDIRYGLRSLVNNRGFTLVALLTLGLGIGASIAIFAVLYGVLLKPLPYPDPDRLVVVYESSKEEPETGVSYPAYLGWRAEQGVFDSMAALMPAGGVLTGGEPERVIGRWVSASFFQTLGIQPEIGRAFTEAEDRPGAERVMVLGYNLWRRRFGGDRSIVGQAIQYNSESWTVVGVMPVRFDFYGQSNIENDFFIPLGLQAEQEWMHDRQSHSLMVMARMKAGATLGQARTEMNSIAGRLSQQYPESEGSGVELHSLTDDYVGESRPALLVIWAAVLMLLLIGCANVASLSLARATGRQKEIAVRIAIGASRRRIVRQLLTESILISTGGCILGLALAHWSIGLLTTLGPDSLPRLEEVTIDLHSLGYAVLTALLSAMVFGLAPALQSANQALCDTLKEGGGRASAGGGRRRLSSSLVIAEIAMSATLLIGAGLLLKSFWRLLSVDAGFNPQNVLTLRLRLPDAKYRDSRQTTGFLKEVMRRVEGLPGVNKVAVAGGFPLGRFGKNGYWLEGQTEPPRPADWPTAIGNSVSERYHEVLGIRLLAGRYFTAEDTADAPKVVVVDGYFVQREFPGGSPSDALGKRLRYGGAREPWREIIGVVSHVRQYGLDEEKGEPEIYGPWLQIDPKWLAEFTRAEDLIVKSSVEPTSLIPDIKREVQLVDKDEPLGNVRTLEALVSSSIAPRKLSSRLMGLFAVASLLVSAIGLYGLIAYSVAQRTQEIGIRMAVGAGRGDILSLVIGEGIKLAVIGVAVGLVAAAVLTRWMESLLFGIKATDPVTFVAVSALLSAVALAASYVPARRAIRVDVAAALRSE